MGLTQSLKDIWAVAQKIDNAPLLRAIAEANMECADLMNEKAALTQENVRLRGEIADLQRRLELREEMVFEENVYWLRPKGARTTREGPFCPACLDDRGKVIRLQVHRNDYSTDYYECPVCQCRADDPHGTPVKDPNAGRPTTAQLYR